MNSTQQVRHAREDAFFRRGYLSLTHSLRVAHKLTTMKFGLKKLEISLYSVVQMRVDILNRLGMAHECDGQTDEWTGQTDRITVRNSAVLRRAIKT